MRLFSIVRLLPLHVFIATMLPASTASAADVAFARHLSLSPEGQTLAFSWAGDVWTVPIDGGLARRMTVDPAHDSHPVWSHDGRRLAFASARHGAANVFVMNRDGTGVTRVTFDDRPAFPSDWSRDNAEIYFHSRAEGQVFWEPMTYRVAATGGQPWRLMDCYAASTRVSPDGSYVAFVRGRSNWWRRGYRGSANYDIWLYHTRTGEFTQLTDFPGTDRQPCWDADGRGLYYLSERGGPVNVWYHPLNGDAPRQVTFMEGDDVRDLDVSADGRMLVFTHWDKLYALALPDGRPREIRIVAAGDPPHRPVEWRDFRRDADELEVSPDGKEIAFVVRGEIFVISTEDEKWTRRVTNSPARDRLVTWSPDGKALFFVSDETGVEQICRATSAEQPPKPLSDSLRFRIEQVTDHPDACYAPAVSPDGKQLAYLRLRGDLVIRDLKTGEQRVLLPSWNVPTFRWSPDSRWIAYSVEDHEHNADVWVVPADGSQPPVNISQHPDYDGNPQWSADGQILTFTSRRTGFDTDIYLVFLSSELDELSPVDLKAYFDKAGEAAKKRKPLKAAVASGPIRLAGPAPDTAPVEPDAPATQPDAAPSEKDKDADRLLQQLRALLKSVLEDPRPDPDKPPKEDEEEPPKTYEYDLATAYLRIRPVTRLPEDQSEYALAPDGALLAFVSSHEGSPAVFTVKWNGEDRKRILGHAVGSLHWDLAGKRLFYLRNGVPNSCTPTGGDTKTHDFSAKMAIDYVAEARQKFFDGARALGRGFYHPTMKDLDWPALTARYADLALRTFTLTEFNEVFNMLLGELNASHMGIFGGARRDGAATERTGYLGCTFDPTYAGPGLKVAAVTPRSPAARAESRLVPGDILLTANGQDVGPADPLDRALVETIGDPVVVTFIPSPDRTAPTATQPADAEAQPSDGDADDAPAQPEPQPTGGDVDDTPAQSEPPPSEGDDVAADPSVGRQEPPDSPPPAPVTQDVIIRPISYGDLAELEYDAWVEANRAYVEEHSAGRVGYVHIQRMNVPSFEQFQRDLYAAAHGKEGLIIDVRNNGGGWTADWILASLMVRRHAYTVPRGGVPGYPQNRLIFYAWTRPTTMLCNQYSYSNAEIISHAFKNLGRGKLVGMTTFGAVISTGAYRLVDGAFVRMPSRGWYTIPGDVDMEIEGAVPDILVPEGPAEEAAGRQPQLDAAIRATLEQIEAEQAAGIRHVP